MTGNGIVACVTVDAAKVETCAAAVEIADPVEDARCAVEANKDPAAGATPVRAAARTAERGT